MGPKNFYKKMCLTYKEIPGVIKSCILCKRFGCKSFGGKNSGGSEIFGEIKLMLQQKRGNVATI